MTKWSMFFFENQNRSARPSCIDSTAVSIFAVILVELTNTVFVNSTNIPTNIEAAVLSRGGGTFQLCT